MDAVPTLIIAPPQPANASTSAPKRRRRSLRIVLALLVLLVLLGSGLSVFFLLSQRNTVTTSTVVPIVGHAFFESSGFLSKESTQGINDELLLAFQNIPTPHPGKSYYAWLLGDKQQTPLTVISLGKLQVTQGAVHLLYLGDAHHDNLLATTSRLLITEEDATSSPSSPSQDTRTWRYYAELAQTPSTTSGQQGRQIDHLRTLLASDPALDAHGLQGGLDIWHLRNTARMLEWAGSARDDWKSQSVSLMRNHFTRILNYLDGPSSIQVGGSMQPAPGYRYYVEHIDQQLKALLAAPGTTETQRTLALQVIGDLQRISGWLEQMRQDAVHLQTLSDEQLLLPSSLLILDDMTTQALHAYTGRLDPRTNEVQGGVTQIHDRLGQLATFDITPYSR
jgi:hypothetical protein